MVDEMVWLIRLCRIIAKNYESDRGASREELAMAYVYREVERDMEEILGMSVVDAP